VPGEVSGALMSGESMKLEDVLEIWSLARLAEVLDTSISNVCGWAKTGEIPRSREYELQVKSGGRLQASNYDPDRDYLSMGPRNKRNLR